MITFKMAMAKLNITATVNYESTVDFCKEFVVDEFTDDNFKVNVEVSVDDIAAERVIPADFKFSNNYLEPLALYRKIVGVAINDNVILFHGCVVGVGDRAFMFTAASGTGKTTHSKLWLENCPDAYIVNGDKPLLRIDNDGITACATPWRGKEHMGGTTDVKLDSLVILRRANGAPNSIREVTVKEAIPMLMQQVYKPKNDSDMLIKTIKNLDGFSKVRLFELHCNMDVIAYEVAAGALL